MAGRFRHGRGIRATGAPGAVLAVTWPFPIVTRYARDRDGLTVAFSCVHRLIVTIGVNSAPLVHGELRVSSKGESKRGRSMRRSRLRVCPRSAPRIRSGWPPKHGIGPQAFTVCEAHHISEHRPSDRLVHRVTRRGRKPQGIRAVDKGYSTTRPRTPPQSGGSLWTSAFRPATGPSESQ